MRHYFDNASTTWPKPPCVGEAMGECLRDLRGSPGRSDGGGPLDQVIPQTRARLARLFNIRDPRRIALTFNATGALNLAIQGFLRPGDRAVTTSMEHNAVCRPLNVLRAHRGLQVEIVRSSPEGYVDLDYDAGTANLLVRSFEWVKHDDVRGFPDGWIDLCLFNGNIHSTEIGSSQCDGGWLLRPDRRYRGGKRRGYTQPG